MNLLAFLATLCFLVYLHLGIYALISDRKSKLNRIFFLFTFGFAIYSLAEVFKVDAAAKADCWFWLRVGAFGWGTFASFFLHFSLKLAGHDRLLSRKWAYLLIYGPAAVFLAHTLTGITTAKDFVQTPLGWCEVMAVESPWFWAFSVYYAGFITLALCVLWRYAATVANRILAKQARLVLLAALPPFLLGSLTNFLLPAMGIYLLPPTASPIFIIFGAYVILYAIAKYRFLTLTPKAAAESIVATMPDALVLLDTKGEIQSVNHSLLCLLGYTDQELLHRPASALFDAMEFDLTALLGKESILNYEAKFRTKQGGFVDIEFSASSVKDNNGEDMGIVIIAKDITGRRKAEEIIRKRLGFEKLISGVSSRLVGSGGLDAAISSSLVDIGTFVGADRAFVFMLRDDGIMLENTHEWCAEGIAPQKDKLKKFRSEFMSYFLRRLCSEGVIYVRELAKLPLDAQSEKDIFSKRGVTSLLLLPLSTKEKFVGFAGFENVVESWEWKDEDLSLIQLLAEIFGNALQRDATDKLLQTEKERLSITLNSIADGVIATDREGRVVLINKIAEQLTGWPQNVAEGRPVGEIFTTFGEKSREPEQPLIDRVFRTGGIASSVSGSVLQSLDGTERAISESAAPIRDTENRIIGAVLVFRDVTESRRLEQERLQAQKLDSVAALANGIGHDFNNILTTIMGNISIVKTLVHPGDELEQYLEDMENASLDAKNLTQQLLAFAKGGVAVSTVLAVEPWLRDSVKFALRSSKSRYEFSVEDGLWAIEADEGQLRQVINGIVLNADQAMTDGGLIRVRAENAVVVPEHRLPLEPGRYVRLDITDHGIGIPAEHLDKIFEPYFSTRQKNNGLSLAVSYSIVKHHKGHIAVASAPGRGTTFSLYLPATEKAAPAADAAAAAGTVVKGQGRILVMDDDELVLKAALIMLRKLGYEPVGVQDGESVLSRYQADAAAGRPFSAVLLDLTIPGSMSGKDVVEKLRVVDPAVKAVITTGYANNDIMLNYRDSGIQEVMPKPFTMEELSKVLSRVLSGASK